MAAFSQSWKRSNELTKVQQQNNYPPHKLKGDVSTRWGSTAVMVRRILEQKEAIRVILSRDRATSHLAITWQDIDLLTSIDSFYVPLKILPTHYLVSHMSLYLLSSHFWSISVLICCHQLMEILNSQNR